MATCGQKFGTWRVIMAISFGICRTHIFDDRLFAQIGSLEELVQICFGGVGNNLWDQEFREVEHSGWWMTISVSRCLRIVDCVLVQID